MRKVYLTQTYELTVSVELEVPDDYTGDDLANTFTDFPINATVLSLWDDEDSDDVSVGSLFVDSLISLNGATTFADENGEQIKA